MTLRSRATSTVAPVSSDLYGRRRFPSSSYDVVSAVEEEPMKVSNDERHTTTADHHDSLDSSVNDDTNCEVLPLLHLESLPKCRRRDRKRDTTLVRRVGCQTAVLQLIICSIGIMIDIIGKTMTVKADQIVPETVSPTTEGVIVTPAPSVGFTTISPVATTTFDPTPQQTTDNPVVTGTPTGFPIPTDITTIVPTEAPQPSEITTSSPTVSNAPTGIPSDMPSTVPTISFRPTNSPTLMPSGFPTFGEPVTSTGRFSQRFEVGNGMLFSEQELFLIEGLYRSYTPNFVQPPGSFTPGLITTQCTVDSQVEIITTVPTEPPGTRQLSSSSSSASAKEEEEDEVMPVVDDEGSLAWKKENQEIASTTPQKNNKHKRRKQSRRRNNFSMRHRNNTNATMYSFSDRSEQSHSLRNGNMTSIRQNQTRYDVQSRHKKRKKKPHKTKPKQVPEATIWSSSSSSLSSSTLPLSTVEVHAERRRLQNVEVIQLDYTMSYESLAVNVSLYPVLFQNYINSNTEQVALQLQTLGLNVTAVQIANRIIPRTMAPSVSMMPSQIPTQEPSVSPEPTGTPTMSPSSAPTEPANPPSNNVQSFIIPVSVVVALLIVGVGLMIWCRNRKQRREMKMSNSAMRKSSQQGGLGGMSEQEGSAWDGHGGDVGPHSSYHSGNTNNNNSAYFGRQSGESQESNMMYGSAFRQYTSSEGRDQALAVAGAGAIVSPAESRMSNRSLLSAGNPMSGGSVGGMEPDSTQMLADEFDQYQDHDLERMRADVEGNLEGCDGMMNQAVARALIEEDDLGLDNENATDYLWGCPSDATGVEIEAGALWYVVDWLKRNNKASVEEKRSYMQEILNKMVASVRKGCVGPEDASRTIHECGALLGVQLAAEMSSTTIAITGMRKNATARDIRAAFSKFGTVVTAEVAPNQRGFGILRFSTEDAVNKAIGKYKTDGEVVVQDVGVQLRAIRPDSQVQENGDAANVSNGQIP